jgi:large subunit ribosomal protein L10
MRREAHVAEWKKKTVKELETLAQKYPVIGISDIEGFPASDFQQLRKTLGDKAVIKVAKSNLFRRLIQDKSELKELEPFLDRPTAFIFTEMNPFQLFKILKQNSSKSFAKPGQIASEDIVIPKGDTGLPPGPALGDLRNAGIEARIAEGSIKVIKESVVARKGEEITPEAALALTKLGVKPIELRLYLEAAIENGQLFTSQVLDIDEEQTLQNLQTGFQNAFNLAFNAGYYTPKNVELFVFTAFNNARNLGINAMILEKGVVEELISKAGAQAKTPSTYVKEQSPEKPEEKGEEKPEGKKAEKKEEDKKQDEGKQEEKKPEEKTGEKEESKEEKKPEKN